MAKRIITINRMFGSNGRLIGKTLAEKMEIGFASGLQKFCCEL